jgi:hypothetical protein
MQLNGPVVALAVSCLGINRLKKPGIDRIKKEKATIIMHMEFFPMERQRDKHFSPMFRLR